MSSDTPRTDSLIGEWGDDGATRGSAYVLLRDLCREIERENEELRRETTVIAYKKLEEQLGEARSAVASPSIQAALRGASWRDAKDDPPDDGVLVVGRWARAYDSEGRDWGHSCERLKRANFQVTFLRADQWWAFYCGNYDAQLVPPTQWAPMPDEPTREGGINNYYRGIQRVADSLPPDVITSGGRRG